MKQIKTFIKTIGCTLIGWDKGLLNQCSEASQRQFYKLTSAVTIMMILWGTIGYCFAENYMNMTSLLAKCAISLAFLVIILCIERVIILTVGKARLMGLIRILLALVMAALGSTIFDQMIFRNDIQSELDIMRLDRVDALVKNSTQELDEEINNLTVELRKLKQEFDSLNIEYQSKPIIKNVIVDKKVVPNGSDENGNPKTKIVVETSTIVVENPIKGQIDELSKTKDTISVRKNERINEKIHVREVAQEKIDAQPKGFIEELMATVNVVSRSGWTIGFYCIMFAFLMLLETFVVSIKLADTKCDYDLIVEHQLKVKEIELKKALEEIRKKYLTNDLK